MKKLIVMVSILAIVGVSMTMLSCAKKQVGVAQPVKEAPKPAPAAAPAPSVSEVEKAQKLRSEIQAFESTAIYFDFDKSEIKPEAKAVLEKKAAWLREHPEYKVRVEGNCDDRGTNEYNLALGDRRAKAALKYFIALGISADRMSTISYGEERPVCTEQTEACWAKNRRDDFKLSK